MAHNIKALALDFGSSNGRGITGEFDGNIIVFSEAARYKNQAIEIRGNLYWDIAGMYKFACDTIRQNTDISCIGVDTWGVDFGMLDSGGNLVALPRSYRDPLVNNIAPEVFETVSEYELFISNGVIIEPICPLIQLYYWKKCAPEILAATHSIQLMANLVAYLITGDKSFDNTMASASGFYDIGNDRWNREFLERLDLPDVLPPTDYRPDIIGKTSTAAAAGREIPVMRVCGHDTSSALMAVPTQDRKKALYVSCGSWVMAGCYLDKPLVTREAYEARLSSENGFKGEINFLRYINGLYILQECEKEWFNRDHYRIDYARMEEIAALTGFDSFIDPDYHDFLSPGDMCDKINRFLSDTGQRQADSREEIYAAIMNGIAVSVTQTFNDVKRLVPHDFENIYIVGGGSRSEYLCRRISQLSGMPVTAGPAEATAIGNICAQLIGNGELQNLGEATQLLKVSMETRNIEK